MIVDDVCRYDDTMMTMMILKTMMVATARPKSWCRFRLVCHVHSYRPSDWPLAIQLWAHLWMSGRSLQFGCLLQNIWISLPVHMTCQFSENFIWHPGNPFQDLKPWSWKQIQGWKQNQKIRPWLWTEQLLASWFAPASTFLISCLGKDGSTGNFIWFYVESWRFLWQWWSQQWFQWWSSDVSLAS